MLRTKSTAQKMLFDCDTSINKRVKHLSVRNRILKLPQTLHDLHPCQIESYEQQIDLVLLY